MFHADFYAVISSCTDAWRLNKLTHTKSKNRNFYATQGNTCQQFFLSEYALD